MDEKATGHAARRAVAAAAPRSREHVVVGVQGDDASVGALQWAARYARVRGAEIEAVMAWELPVPPRHMTGDLRDAAQAVMSDLRWALEAIVDRSAISALTGLDVSTTVVMAPAKVAMADSVDRADLLVLGSVQHSVALAALSVGRQAAASASCPVVLVPLDPAQSPQRSGDRLVVGVDGSPQSRAALHWACDDAKRRRLPVSVVTVAPSKGDLEVVTEAVAAARSAFPTVAISLVTRVGDAGEVLLEESVGAEALVVGQHGSGTLRSRLPALGSVSRWCAAHPVSPVVVVPRRRHAQVAGER
jgi:nucleotide-binding universal stress UspA family protein